MLVDCRDIEVEDSDVDGRETDVEDRDNDIEGNDNDVDSRLSELLISVAGIVSVVVQEAKLLGKTLT